MERTARHAPPSLVAGSGGVGPMRLLDQEAVALGPGPPPVFLMGAAGYMSPPWLTSRSRAIITGWKANL